MSHDAPLHAAAADRYVLLGNHRDAWVFGAVDPTSGTAVMLEISRVLAKLVNEEGIYSHA